MNTAAGWQTAVVDALAASDSPSANPRWRPSAASSLSEIWWLDAGGIRYFVKMQAEVRLAMLEAAAEGLRALATAKALRVPGVFAVGAADGCAFLVLEGLALERGACGAALGSALARLHRSSAPHFGWHRDNTIGTTPQQNAWSDDWIAFWRTRRLAPQLALAIRNGHGGALEVRGGRLLDILPRFFAGYTPVASLLHGDLWSGNQACLPSGEPVVYDPAVYYGDRETDLAMTELFGGFSDGFYAAYAAAWPLHPGYARRRTLYNLYHVLNHLNLFGGSYRPQAEAMLTELVHAV